MNTLDIGKRCINILKHNYFDLKFSNHKEYKIPKIVNNKWVLQRELGSGGFGRVFSCIRNDLEYAIKLEVNWYNAIKNEKLIYEILKKHIKNIPIIYDYGSATENIKFIVMEKLIKLTDPKKYISEIIKVLQNIHSKELVHNDVKFANIMLKSNGAIAFIDMGVCMHVNTNCKTPFGTPNYMSIHQHNLKVCYANDLESLFYSYLELNAKMLPWEELYNDLQLVLQSKILFKTLMLELSVESYINFSKKYKLDERFYKFGYYVYSLKVSDSPNYKSLIKMFK